MKCISLFLILLLSVSISFAMRKGEYQFVRMLDGIEYISYNEFCQYDSNNCLFKSEEEFQAFKAMYILNKNLRSKGENSFNEQKNILNEKYSKIKQPQTEIEKSYTKVFEDAYNKSKEKKFNMITKLKEINSTEDFQINKNISNINQEEKDHQFKKNLQELFDFNSDKDYHKSKNMKDLFMLFEKENNLDFHLEKLIKSMYISTVGKLEYQVSKIIDKVFELKNGSNNYNVTKFIEDLYSHSNCNIYKYNISAIVEDINQHKDKDGVPYYINKIINGLCNKKTRELEYNLTRLIDGLYGDRSNSYKLSKMMNYLDSNLRDNYTEEINIENIYDDIDDIEQNKNYNLTRKLLKFNLKMRNEAKLNISRMIKNQIKNKTKNQDLKQHDDFDLLSLISDFNDCKANTKFYNHTQILEKYHLDDFNKDKYQDKDYEISGNLKDIDSIKNKSSTCNKEKICNIDKTDNNTSCLLNNLMQILKQQNQIILQVSRNSHSSQCCCNSCSKNNNHCNSHMKGSNSKDEINEIDKNQANFDDHGGKNIFNSKSKFTKNTQNTQNDENINAEKNNLSRDLKSRESSESRENYKNIRQQQSSYINQDQDKDQGQESPKNKTVLFHKNGKFFRIQKSNEEEELTIKAKNCDSNKNKKDHFRNYNNTEFSNFTYQDDSDSENTEYRDSILKNKKITKISTVKKNTELNSRNHALRVKVKEQILKTDSDVNEENSDSEKIVNNKNINNNYLKSYSRNFNKKIINKRDQQTEKSKFLQNFKIKNLEKLRKLRKNNFKHINSSKNKKIFNKFSYENKVSSDSDSDSDSNHDDRDGENYHDQEECLLHYKIHIHTLKDFFENFIEGYKSIPSKARKFIRGGKIFKIEETFNAFFFCKRCKLNTGIKAYYLDMLKDTLRNLGIRNLKSDISQITKQIKIVILAIGDRCQGIDTILELITKDSEYVQIENQMDLNQVAVYKRDALKYLSNGLYDKAGYNLGQIYGLLKNFPKC